MWKKIIVVSIVSVLIVCGFLDVNSLTPVQSAEGVSDVSVRMKWFFAGTMVPWFYGRSSGIFRRHKINLSVRPGGPDNSSVKLVAAGSDLFGVAGSDEALLARQKGVPIVAIGVIFKDSPVSFVAHSDSGIKTPVDWSNKRIEIIYGNSEEVQYRSLVKKYGVHGQTEVPYTYSLVPFIERKVDVSIAYSMDQVVTLKRRNIALTEMRAKDFGVNPYGDVIITREDTLRNRPELVRDFIAALRDAITGAVSNPQMGVHTLVQAVPTLSVDNETAVWMATIPFLKGPDGRYLLMDRERWVETRSLLEEFGFLNSGLNLDDAVKYVDPM